MRSPTHEEITRRAEELWQDYGRPSGRDEAIWLEAEQQISTHATLSESHSEHALAEQAATQRKEALAPQRASKSAPKPEPAETGKPLWNNPHSR